MFLSKQQQQAIQALISLLIFGLIVGWSDQGRPETLQTQITQHDLVIIDRLVQIAQTNSVEVKTAKAALGVSAFQDVVSLEFGPSQSFSSSDSVEEPTSSNESGFFVTVTVEPIRVMSAIQQLPILSAGLANTKRQKRVEVVKLYMAYLQARQSAKIARISAPAQEPAIAAEQLAASGQELIALEELAASLGLTPQATLAAIAEPPP